MSSPSLPELLAFAEALADLARPIARHYFRSGLAVDTKLDRSPVTLADREIERSLRAQILARFPTHGIVGEEDGRDRAEAEFVWVLDPIDGTKAFTAGNPLFGTLVGLLHRGDPVVGVLDAPALGERWCAARGLGATHQRRRIAVRPTTQLADAVLACTTTELLLDHPAYRRLRQQVRWSSHGGDCCTYGFLANGGLDLVVDRGLQPYDWCALVPIVQEAGGVITDWQGRALSLGSAGDVLVAGTAALAAAARTVLADAR